jgi:oligoribonuclease NrnB/cAMP/cGMP phosphodiesterase (DHH superfamily)
MKTIVISHANCIDGFTAAWVAWLHFGDKAEYIFAKHGDPPPNVNGADVLMLDFAYDREIVEKMYDDATSLFIWDHHKTKQEALQGLEYAFFDMERSGAGLAWDHFFGSERRPWLVDYVEDRDLWRFKLPESKAVNAWVSAQKQTFGDWMNLSQMQVKTASFNGTAVLAYIDRYVEEMSEQARNVDFMGYRVPIVNAPYLCISELVGKLAETAPFAIGWFQRRDGMYQYSLRSRSNSNVDVSEIAKRFPGGGGHKGSAGFTVTERLKL